MGGTAAAAASEEGGLERLGDDVAVEPRLRAAESELRSTEPERSETGPGGGGELMWSGRTHYEVQIKKRTVQLTPTEFEIMATLMSQPGRIFSRNQLLNAAHGVAFESYERAIDSHIRNLRRKLEPDELIVTVHGVGYKFEA